MEGLFALSLFVMLVLVLVCVLLALDARGERKALRVALDAMQRRAQGQDEQIGTLVRALTQVSTGQLPTEPRTPVPAPAGVELESMTEPQGRQALTIDMVRPTVETPQPLAVKVGAEVVELDAETIARIEALKEDVNAGRTDGHLLQLLIEAGLDKAEQGDRVSGEVPREPEAHDSDEPTPDTPADEVTPTPPKKPSGR
jgi:hypothetical protein